MHGPITTEFEGREYLYECTPFAYVNLCYCPSLLNRMFRSHLWLNPELAGFLNPKQMKGTVYITVDQWSDTMPFSMACIHSLNPLKNL